MEDQRKKLADAVDALALERKQKQQQIEKIDQQILKKDEELDIVNKNDQHVNKRANKEASKENDKLNGEIQKLKLKRSCLVSTYL